MTEQETERPKVEETEEQSEVTETGDEQPHDEGKTKSDEDSEQLKAELEKERKAREDAEKALADKAFRERNKKRKETEEEEEEVTDKPLTRKEYEQLRAQDREAIRKELQEQEADRLAASLAVSDEEKQLIIEKWKNRSFPTHLSLQEQIEECYAIANRKKLIGERNEALRALKNKQRVNADASSTFHEEPTGTQPKLAAGDAAVMAQVGFKWNSTSKRYEKKLANGDVLVKDPKSKQTQLIRKA